MFVVANYKNLQIVGSVQGDFIERCCSNLNLYSSLELNLSRKIEFIFTRFYSKFFFLDAFFGDIFYICVTLWFKAIPKYMIC